MKNFDNLKVGDKLICVNSEGWDGFEKGGVYTVTEVWEGWRGVNINLDDSPVACQFAEDFELYEEDVQ